MKEECVPSDPEQSLQTFFDIFTLYAVVDAALLLDALGASAWQGIGMHLHELALGACDAHHGFASRQLPQARTD